MGNPAGGSTEGFSKGFGDLYKGLGGSFFGGGNHLWNTLIPPQANLGKDGYLTQESQLLALGFSLAAAMAEYLHTLAAWGYEVTHVLDDAQNRDVDLFKHGNAFADDAERGFLRRGD